MTLITLITSYYFEKQYLNCRIHNNIHKLITQQSNEMYVCMMSVYKRFNETRTGHPKNQILSSFGLRSSFWVLCKTQEVVDLYFETNLNSVNLLSLLFFEMLRYCTGPNLWFFVWICSPGAVITELCAKYGISAKYN